MRTGPRKARRHGYIRRSICLPAKVFGGSPHTVWTTNHTFDEIPIELRTMWAAMYEKVKVLKVTFKYWIVDMWPHVQNLPGVTYDLLPWFRVPEFRWSYDPDCQGRTMNSNNIWLRRNAHHTIGNKLYRPWFLRLRPTYNRGSNVTGKISTPCNSWFDCEKVFGKESVRPVQRNGYLCDFLNKYDQQKIAVQKTYTLGFKIAANTVNNQQTTKQQQLHLTLPGLTPRL